MTQLSPEHEAQLFADQEKQRQDDIEFHTAEFNVVKDRIAFSSYLDETGRFLKALKKQTGHEPKPGTTKVYRFLSIKTNRSIQVSCDSEFRQMFFSAEGRTRLNRKERIEIHQRFITGETVKGVKPRKGVIVYRLEFKK